MAKLFGVNLPKTNWEKLGDDILQLENGDRASLYFLYSEFLLRANRNPSYKRVLQNADLLATDGKGLLWSQWQVEKSSLLPKLYISLVDRLPWFLSVVVAFVFLLCQLVLTAFSVIYRLLTRFDFSTQTGNSLVLGRDFVYRIFEISEKRNWKVLIVGGNPDNNESIKSKLGEKYPTLELEFWSKDATSDLMKDRYAQDFEQEGLSLRTENLLKAFPDLKEAKNLIKESVPDVILVCLGGASGKQEFFIDYLKQYTKVEFTLATGVGAALDHLGSGAGQTVAPSWMVKIGMEWVHRFVSQPYRRLRILDSVFTLWWWTTIQQFTQVSHFRDTVVNVVDRLMPDKTSEYLLLERLHWITGDTDWGFVQGGIESGESVQQAGLRELREETELEIEKFKFNKSLRAKDEEFAVSLIHLLAFNKDSSGAKYHVAFWRYLGQKEPKSNWENGQAKWFKEDEVAKYLSVEKQDLL